MKSLADITEAIGSEKWVTISAISPILHKLLEKHLKPSSSDSNVMKEMKQAIRCNLEGRYLRDRLDLLNKATFLDPRFKGLNFMEKNTKDTVVEMIRQESILMAKAEKEDTQDREPPPKKPRKEQKLITILGDVIQPQAVSADTQEESTAEEKAKAEVFKDLAEEQVTDVNPLKRWKDNSFRYPMSEMVKRYLCIPATSTPSKRVFSKAGHIVNDRRACLLPETVNMLVFLSGNLDI